MSREFENTLLNSGIAALFGVTVLSSVQSWPVTALTSAQSRPYHQETVDSLKASIHTHVQVAGTVTMVRREQDGDWHIRISDADGHFVVAEIIPTLHADKPLRPPVKGQAIVAFGIRRDDNERGHGWSEIHPLERWIEAVK